MSLQSVMAAVRRHLGTRVREKEREIFRLHRETVYLCEDEKWLHQTRYHLYNKWKSYCKIPAVYHTNVRGKMQRVKNNTADNPTQSGLMMILLFNTKGRKNVKMDTTHTIYTVAWEFLSEY